MTNERKQASIEDLLEAFNKRTEVLEKALFSFGHLDVNSIWSLTNENYQLALSNVSNALIGLSQGLYHLESDVECFIDISENGIARVTSRHIFGNMVYGTVYIQEGMKVAGILSSGTGILYLSKVK